MVSIDFYPLDAVQKLEGDSAVIYIYGKSKDERVCVRYSSFIPYFLVIPKKGQEDVVEKYLKNLTLQLEERKTGIGKVEKIKKILGTVEVTCFKCETPIPKDIPKLAYEIKENELIEHVYEKDIHFIQRFLVDNNIIPLEKHTASGEFIPGKNRAKIFKADKIELASDETYSNLSIMAIDIETPSKDIDPKKYPILMIAVYSQGIKRVLTWNKFPVKGDFVEFLPTEEDMYKRFAEIIRKDDPDIICGYYSDGFDWPYIKKRADHLGVEFKPGLNNSAVRLTGTKVKKAYIEGLIHVDVFKFIRYIWAQGLSTTSYDLDSVAKEILGIGKIEVDISRLGKIWGSGDKELGKFAEYNLRDTEVTYKLCQKILPDIVEFVKLTRLMPFDMSRSRFSKLVEGYLITKAYNDNIIIPNLPGHKSIAERRRSSFQGAYVYEPTPGLYKNVAVFDYRSLYPSIISAHNISPETLQCKCCKDTAEKVPGRDDIWFCTKKVGFIPGVIKELITRRVRLKEIIKQQETSAVMEARSHALKTLANAMWGYMGYFGSRWYAFDAALSITAYGRHYLTEVIKSAEKAGFKVIYGDTDSIFLDLNGKTLDEAKDFAININDTLPDIMELQFEGTFPSALFVSTKTSTTGAKKKYAMISKEGKMKITGFEYVRRNWSLLAREAQKHVLEIILKDNDVKKAQKYIIDLVAKVRKNEIEKKKMIIKTQLTKSIKEYNSISPHVAVAKKMIAGGQTVQVGDIIHWIVQTGSGKVGERAIEADMVEKPDYDTDYYVNKQIIPAVDSIFLELGIKPDEILAKKDQSALSKFF